MAVVDASVALAWVIPDEQAAPAAMRLLLAFHANQVELVAPSLWEYEMANALKVAVARRRISEGEGRAALKSLADLGIPLSSFSATVERAWELALKHRLAIYDAAYLALAERRQCVCYTADRHLIRAAARTGLVRRVEEFD